MNDLVQRAAAFAKAAHESVDQRRKYTNQPYIVHPKAVAELVSSVTNDPSTIAAAWLHDVVEDTPVEVDTVHAEFGAEVASLVADLTDISQPSDGNRKQRLAIDRRHTAQADPRAKTVKLADVIHNVSDIVQNDPDFAPIYIDEKHLLLSVLKEGDPALYRQAEKVLRDSKERLAEGP